MEKRIALYKWRAILFDFDGPVNDALTINERANELTLCDLGVGEYDRKFLQRYFGPGMVKVSEAFSAMLDYCEKAGIHINRSKEEAMARWKQHYLTLDETGLYVPGALEMIGQLKTELNELGGGTAICTNLSTSGMARHMERINPYFDVVVTHDTPNSAKKPLPLMYFEACRQLEVDPNEACSVGDRPEDGEAALAAGIVHVETTEHGWPDVSYGTYYAQRVQSVPIWGAWLLQEV